MDEIFYYIIICLGLFVSICSPIIIFCCDFYQKKNIDNDNIQFEKKPLLITNL